MGVRVGRWRSLNSWVYRLVVEEKKEICAAHVVEKGNGNFNSVAEYNYIIITISYTLSTRKSVGESHT